MRKMYKKPNVQTTELLAAHCILEGSVIISTDPNVQGGVGGGAPSVRVAPKAAPAPLQ